MLIDTDVIIWNLRGNEAAAALLDDSPRFLISAVSYMELVQGLRDKTEFRALRQSLHFWQAEICAVDESICSRAIYLVEQYALSHNLGMADALIAATALDIGTALTTANDKHYRHIDGLELQIFRP